MRRFEPPFNGKRYLLNRSTGEIHDLENETEQCNINRIKHDNIWMDESYMGCVIASSMFGCPHSNGCYYCLKEEDNG